MNLKDLAEKVKKLPEKKSYTPKRLLDQFYNMNFNDLSSEDKIERLASELFECQILISCLGDAYNALRDIILEAKIE